MITSSYRDNAKVDVMGLPFDAVTERDAVDKVIGSLLSGAGGWVVTPNTDFLRKISDQPELKELILRADLVLADGMPIIWASRLQGHALPERVPGSALIYSLARAAAAAGVPVFLLGGNAGVAERAAVRLRAEFPLIVLGHHHPPFGFETRPDDVKAIDSAVASFGTGIYFCGLGFPKQERLITQLRERDRASWFIACGAGLSFLAGETTRAPGWAQRSGLEWLFRLAQEPRRLFRRYIVEDMPYAALMMLRSLTASARP